MEISKYIPAVVLAGSLATPNPYINIEQSTTPFAPTADVAVGYTALTGPNRLVQFLDRSPHLTRSTIQPYYTDKNPDGIFTTIKPLGGAITSITPLDAATSSYRDTTLVAGIKGTQEIRDPKAALLVSQDNKKFHSVTIPGDLSSIAKVSHVDGTNTDDYIGRVVRADSFRTTLGVFDETTNKAMPLSSLKPLPYLQQVVFSQILPDGKRTQLISLAQQIDGATDRQQTLAQTIINPHTKSVEQTTKFLKGNPDNITEADVKVKEGETDIAYVTETDVVEETLPSKRIVRNSLAAIKKQFNLDQFTVTDVTQTPNDVVLAGTTDQNQVVIALGKQTLQSDKNYVLDTISYPSGTTRYIETHSIPALQHFPIEQDTVYGETPKNGAFAVSLKAAKHALHWLNKNVPLG